MGKPFERELEFLPKTLEWANTLELAKLSGLFDTFSDPIYVVGSGGSFSACVFAADLLTSQGHIAKALTPLELFNSSSTLRKVNIIFISSSGKNTDILFAFKKAIEHEPKSITNICMKKNTKLSTLASRYSSTSSFEFEPKSGRDGFLATNTLLAYFVILYRVILRRDLTIDLFRNDSLEIKAFLKRVKRTTTFIVLYGSYNRAVAVDIESKLSEAGLAPSLVSDFRQFAHGRHQWLDKKPDSAIIALTSEEDRLLCEKTLALLPEGIPKLQLDAKFSRFEGAIELLNTAMEFVRFLGLKMDIDPGRPGVPDYGSKLYHLKYERLISRPALTNLELAILRKAKVNHIEDLSPDSYQDYKQHYFAYIQKLTTQKYGSLVLDYDGTLCSPFNRFENVCSEVKKALIDFVKRGFVLGVISGRGKSLRIALENIFDNDESLMANVVVGYYNGSDIGMLTQNHLPDKQSELHPSIKLVKEKLFDIGINMDSSPNQLTLSARNTVEWSRVKEALLNELMLLNLDDIVLVESSHSIDLVVRSVVSKNNILEHVRILCRKKGISENMLCIGDRGQWPGNDYELLSNEYSISVGEVSSNKNTCWNLNPPGLRDEKAIISLFERFQYKRKTSYLLNYEINISRNTAH
jgi:hydroxymethylpyrimidine pyrophosphatase-like HAD family hydrolase